MYEPYIVSKIGLIIEIPFLSHNNIDGQHSHIHLHHHRQPWSGRSFEQPLIEFVTDSVVEPNHAVDVNTDDGKDVSRFSDNVNSYRCSARPKDPE